MGIVDWEFYIQAMFSAARVVSTLTSGTVGRRAPLLGVQTRTKASIRILDDKAKGEHALCWHQEERLLTKLVNNSPDLHPHNQGIAGIMHDKISVETKIKLLLMKHGSPPINCYNKALIADLSTLVEKS